MPKSALKRNLVLGALALVLIARLGLASITFTYPQRCIMTDSLQYLKLAESLRLQGRFTGSEYDEEVRTPGYPLFLAAVQAILKGGIGTVVLIQLLFTILIAFLLYRCGKLLHSERLGLAAAWLYALNPNAILWSLTVLTETLFSLLLLLSFYALTLAYQRSQGYWLLSGLLLGMATLTRPIGLYLIPVWGIFALLVLRPKVGFHRAARYAIGFLAAAMLLVLYWQARNYALHGKFSLSTTTEVTISRFIAADTLADALHIDRDEARLIILNAADPMAYSYQVMRQYPMSFMRVTIRGIARTALGTDVGTWIWIVIYQRYQSTGFLTALVRGDLGGVVEALKARLQAGEGILGLILLVWGIAYALALYGLIAWGMVRVLRFDHPDISFLRWASILLLVSAAYLILTPLANGDSRFRVPAEPLLALLGGLVFLPRNQFSKRKRLVNDASASDSIAPIPNGG